MSVMDPEPPTVACPECRQGKHANCTVTVLNLNNDKWEACACAHHQHLDYLGTIR